MASAPQTARTIRVLQALRVVRPTTNPYLIMLRRGLQDEPGVDLVDFGYRRALFGRYDLWHLHWPENLFGASSRARRWVRRTLLSLILLRLRLRGIPIVRTVHNLQRPSGLGRAEHRLLDRIDRLTGVWIRLNAHTPTPDPQATVLIRHGHYRDWFAELPRAEQRPGRIGYVGLIRRYKGVETLLTAFRETAGSPGGEELRLRVGGQPSTAELAEQLRELAADDTRIELRLAFLSDPELVDIVTSSELVVLPYRLMHNSGGTLAALSLDRPVLVPANDVNTDLAAEVGPGWVFTFDGDLDAATLIDTLAASGEAAGRTSRPDLSGREWARTATEHVEAFRLALSARPTRRRESR